MNSTSVQVSLVLVCVFLSGCHGASIAKRHPDQNKVEILRILDSMRRSHDYEGSGGIDPDEYLETYGYLGKPSTGAGHSLIVRQDAIRNFQRLAGLAVTGVINEDTLEMMEAPRCGLPDMIPSEPPRGDLGGPHSFVLPGHKWNKTHLTWSVNRISNDGMSFDDHRRAFYRAFQLWSERTPLQFTEVSGPSDINIDFAYGEHGDGFQFDGPGMNLAHAFYPENGEVHFDDAEEWTQYTDRGTNLEIVAAHEFGHALGLGHSWVHDALMYPIFRGYTENFHLNIDDIHGIQTLYGGVSATRPATQHPSGPEYTTLAPKPGNTDKDPCTTEFGAIMHGHDSGMYVFSGDSLWHLNLRGLNPGDFPKVHSEVFPAGPDRVDAAVHSWSSRYTFLFSGRTVWKFHGFEFVETAELRSVSSVQAAFMSRDYYAIYLLEGSQYWEFDEHTMAVTSDTPRSISSKWSGVPDNVDSALRLTGFIYFFKGDTYYKFNEDAGHVVEGYPKVKARAWMGAVCGGEYVPK